MPETFPVDRVLRIESNRFLKIGDRLLPFSLPPGDGANGDMNVGLIGQPLPGEGELLKRVDVVAVAIIVTVTECEMRFGGRSGCKRIASRAVVRALSSRAGSGSLEW